MSTEKTKGSDPVETAVVVDFTDDETESPDRTPRSMDSREGSEREEAWAPPTILPMPAPEPGWKFRWIRTSMLGESDNRNVSMKLREGWIPVSAEDYPDLELLSDHGSSWAKRGNIEVGGLLLCKISEKKVQQRNAYYEKLASGQMEAVDNQFMRENDERMPVLRPERSSKVSFGQGSREA